MGTDRVAVDKTAACSGMGFDLCDVFSSISKTQVAPSYSGVTG